MGGIVNDHFLNKYLTKFLHSKAFTENICIQNEFTLRILLYISFAFCNNETPQKRTCHAAIKKRIMFVHANNWMKYFVMK